MNILKKAFFILIVTSGIIVGHHTKIDAQIWNDNIPHFGAQVFIEPGHTQDKIDNWFRILKENNMTVCRIRLFEQYIKTEDGSWDFSLFDYAFEAADKYGIKVIGTIFPYTEKTDIGGFKFPRDEEHLNSVAEFIRQLVTHYKKFDSLFGWVLINEPGSGSIANNLLAQKKFQEWLNQNPQKENTDKGYPVLMDLTKQRFIMDFNTWYLSWIANEIRKYDQENHLHVNTHAIFDLISEYDFPEWRKFLNSLGGSAHPSWHFGYFNRSQYAIAMSANSEIIRSGAGDLPWIMTEIQGGNNTYSGFSPFCPTSEEITQWLWTTIGSEAKGNIFWTLNPRTSGLEAGEWALLTFQNQPSDRLMAVKKVAETILKNEKIFRQAKVVDSGINLLYMHESLWAENLMAAPSKQNFEGREKGAVIKSVLGYFEAISEMGINCNIKEFNEFDFGKDNYSDQIIILANQLSVPSYYGSELENFVNKGGTLIVDGMTAFFDENLHNTMQTGFPFQNLFGGNISEFKVVDNIFRFSINNQKIPAHLWRGIIENNNGEVISGQDNEIFAISNTSGAGKVIWVPSLLGLGSRISKDYSALNKWLDKEIHDIIKPPLRIENPIPGVFMKTMHSGDSYISILINKSGIKQPVSVVLENKILTPQIIFSDKASQIIDSSTFGLENDDTLVIEWN